MFRRLSVIVFVLFALPLPNAEAMVIESTVSSWNGTTVWGAQIGEKSYNTSVYGQTFVAPASNPFIEDFSIWLSDSPVFDPDPLRFRGYLMEWDLDRAAGDVLYASEVMDTSSHAFHGDWVKHTFEIDTLLNETLNYVFFISVIGLYDGVDSAAFVGATQSSSGLVDGYSSGVMVSLRNRNSFLDSSDWYMSSTGFPTSNPDLIFEATFSPAHIPAPSVFSLILLPLLRILFDADCKKPGRSRLVHTYY